MHKRSTTRKALAWFGACALAALSLYAAPVEARPPKPKPDARGQGGFEGANGRVESLNAPARIYRVAVVPSDGQGNDVWGMAHVTTNKSGWSRIDSGQMVFVRNQDKAGWVVVGPPRDVTPGVSGSPIVNPALKAIAMTQHGEGWAVGDGGTIAHKPSGTTQWTIDRKLCTQQGRCESLEAIAVSRDGNTGYAVGRDGLVLRLQSGDWVVDKQIPARTTGTVDTGPVTGDSGPPTLAAVALSPNGGQPWVIAAQGSDSSGRAIELYERSGPATSPGTWTLRTTGIQALDNPAPTFGGGEVRIGVKGSAATASPDGTFWFGGSFFPYDPANPNGDAATGGTSERPYVVRYKSGAFTAYCTETSTAANQASGSTSICEGQQPFPPSAMAVTSLSAVNNNEVFAGGLGLYHYKPPTGSDQFGRWFREPDPVGYVSSVSFANEHEGWFTSAGGAVGSPVASTSSIAIGHYSQRTRAREYVARWGFPSQAVPYAVAVPPANSTAPPIVVGDDGRVLKKTENGWDTSGIIQDTPGGFRHTHHGVAYAGNTNVAYAVGDAGWVVALENGIPQNPERQVKTRTLANGAAANDRLFGVAFSAPEIGWAVGTAGALVRFNSVGKSKQECFEGLCWAPDPKSGAAELTTNTLYAVARIGTTTGFVAVGDKGTVLVNPTGAPGDWRNRTSEVAALLGRSGANLPALYALDTVGNTIVIGGQRSTLLVVENGTNLASPIKLFESTPDATFFALDARGTASDLRLVASIAPNYNPSRNDSPTVKFDGTGRGADNRGWLVEYDGTRWHDLQHSPNRSTLPIPGIDRAINPDPVYAIAADPDGRSGWAVGGRWAGQEGADGSSYNTTTRSLYRWDLDDSPRSPTDKAQPIRVEEAGYSFAFFSDTNCGSMLCSLAAGTGTAADEIALRIRDDINEAARDRVKGPRFVLFGGSARGSGTPDEIAQFAAYLAGFEIPVFGAPGATDLTPAPVVAPSAPGIPFFNGNLNPPDRSEDVNGPPDTSAYQSVFSVMPEPWGSAKRGDDEQAFIRVGDNAGLDPDCATCPARTHYAFDYKPAGASKSLGRFVVIDTSSKALSPSGQSPNEAQTGFVSTMLQPTSGSVPGFVIMNMPTRDPSTFSNDPILPATDVADIEGGATALGATAVFAGGVHGNYRYPISSVTSSVPVYVAGTGGAPSDGSQHPYDGRYHSWLLATVDPSQVREGHPQAGLTVRSIPVVESVAFEKSIGQLSGGERIVVAGGSAEPLRAIARGIDGGGRSGDVRAMNRLFINLPVPFTCLGAGDQNSFTHQLGGGCFNKRGVKPDYRFVSEDPTIAQFVYSAGSEEPVRVNGRLTPDPQSGLLCTFRTGTVWVRIEAGNRAARMPITVVPGSGPCVNEEVVEFEPLPFIEVVEDPIENPVEHREPPAVAPKAPKVPSPAPPPKPAIIPPPPAADPVPVAKPVPKVFLAPTPLAELIPALMPPAPSLLPSPAPPASATAAGAQKQEDKEVETESAGQEGGDFTAIQHRRDTTFDPAAGWMLMGIAALVGLFGAGVAATMKGGAPRAARVPVTYPRELR